MTATTTDQSTLFAQVLDQANRHDPYPLYARLRQTPVSQQDTGAYVVSTYDELVQLTHDPRISSDLRKADVQGLAGQSDDHPGFIVRDEPDHHQIRSRVMRKFTPARIQGLTDSITKKTHDLLDQQRGQQSMDFVADFFYPLPVAMICSLLGVPLEDEHLFSDWSAKMASALDPDLTDEQTKAVDQAKSDMTKYCKDLADDHLKNPQDDLISALLGDDPDFRLPMDEVLSVMDLLLVAGHETTVNLISNGTLAMLRDPGLQVRVAETPGLEVTFVEEMLRYDPPVQFRTRTALTDIDIAGTTIPKGVEVELLLAAGSRDPHHFPDADVLVPDRTENAHLGYGGGAHYCVGAPLARIEARTALKAVAQRLVNPHLSQDPPEYHADASLRGPAAMPITFDQLR